MPPARTAARGVCWGWLGGYVIIIPRDLDATCPHRGWVGGHVIVITRDLDSTCLVLGRIGGYVIIIPRDLDATCPHRVYGFVGASGVQNMKVSRVVGGKEEE
jgi:hypothetical protein